MKGLVGRVLKVVVRPWLWKSCALTRGGADYMYCWVCINVCWR